jgi:hypothetical protein
LLSPAFEDDDDENSMRRFKGVFGHGHHDYSCFVTGIAQLSNFWKLGFGARKTLDSQEPQVVTTTIRR